MYLLNYLPNMQNGCAFIKSKIIKNVIFHLSKKNHHKIANSIMEKCKSLQPEMKIWCGRFSGTMPGFSLITIKPCLSPSNPITLQLDNLNLSDYSPEAPWCNYSKKEIDIQPIDPNFTINKSIKKQRKAHNDAKKYLMEKADAIHAEVIFISPPDNTPSQISVEVIKPDLDKTTFTWEKTNGVQEDIQKDGKLPGQVVLYGVASQFNACEAIQRFTPKPGTAVKTYASDHTQGPGAQLQFPDQQVEIINNAANLGFNGLCHVLDDTTKMSVKHGYLTPETEASAESVIAQLRKNGEKIDFLCIGNIPKGEGNTEKVYEMLVAAPAFGMYSIGTATHAQKSEIEFLCALHGYRAQFQQAIKLAASNAEKQVVFKPTAVGLGVFGNNVENVAKAFYVAAKEYEAKLIEKNIKVRFQVFQGKGQARDMAMILGLHDANVGLISDI